MVNMSMINASREDYILWLVVDGGWDREDAEKYATFMGYYDEEDESNKEE